MTGTTIRADFGTEWEPWWSDGFTLRSEFLSLWDSYKGRFTIDCFETVEMMTWYYGLGVAAQGGIDLDAVISRVDAVSALPTIYWHAVRTLTAILEGRSTDPQLQKIIHSNIVGSDITSALLAQDWATFHLKATACLRYYLAPATGGDLTMTGAQRFVNRGFLLVSEWGVPYGNS